MLTYLAKTDDLSESCRRLRSTESHEVHLLVWLQ